MIDDVFDTRISDRSCLCPVSSVLPQTSWRRSKCVGIESLTATWHLLPWWWWSSPSSVVPASRWPRFGLFGTEPTNVHVTQPGGGSQAANGKGWDSRTPHRCKTRWHSPGIRYSHSAPGPSNW